MTWQQQFSEHEVQQAVFAIGFELDELSLPKFVVDGKSIDRKDLEAYDRDTGEIKAGGKSLTVSARLFGGGIAFPQNYTDGGGGVEPWVGFKRSIEQIDLMVKNIGTR